MSSASSAVWELAVAIGTRSGAVIPIFVIVLFGQKYLMKGIATTGLK